MLSPLLIGDVLSTASTAHYYVEISSSDMAERIYLDTCTLNRLTDDRSQLRVREEAEAVAHALELMTEGRAHWVASSVVKREIVRNPFPLRRIAALELLSTATEFIEPTVETLLFAQRLTKAGLASMDAVHLATAEQGQAAFLLTTDDRFRRRASRPISGITVQVVNPVDWSQRRQ